MSYEEKGTWVYLVVSAAVYVAYVVRVLGRAATPITDTPYQATLLWAIGVAVVAAIVLRIVVEMFNPSDSYKIDSRDRATEHVSIVRTWWLIIASALAALFMAMAEWPHFWIANALYAGFVLQAIVGSIVRLVAYRRGI